VNKVNDEFFQRYMDVLTECLKLPTIFQQETISESEPYGQRVAQGYQWAKSLGEKWGFDVIETPGHAIAWSLGEGKQRVEAVSHMDVVGVGDDWSVDPFEAKIIDGKLYGRGTQDMKSALVATMLALVYIRENKIPLKHQLRAVFGMDEERTMEDIGHYVKQEGQPLFAFTPDGAYPISGGEKGALMWTLKGKISHPKLIRFSAGTACNVICDKAVFIVRERLAFVTKVADSLKVKYKATEIEEGVLVEVYGKAAHASVPQLGHNAIVDALNVLRYIVIDPKVKALYRTFISAYGSGFDGSFNHPVMGDLTSGLHVLRIENGHLYGEVDVRYPLGVEPSALTSHLQALLNDIEVTLEYDARALLTDMGNPFIRECIRVYQEYTGDRESLPLISGGVTYAKMYDGVCVPYGIKDPRSSTPMLAHQKDEFIEVAYLRDMLNMMIGAMIAIANV
jgi:succinyl-diaminopimelate desuccinylase